MTKDQGLSFTDMAKTVGSGWQALPQAERQHYEKRAAADKERYNAELAEYKKSNKYAEYQRYLERFKQEQGKGLGNKTLVAKWLTCV